MRIDTSPKGVILAATSGGKRVLRGVGRLIHRSAWKGRSPNFALRGCKTLARPRPCAVRHSYVRTRKLLGLTQTRNGVIPSGVLRLLASRPNRTGAARLGAASGLTLPPGVYFLPLGDALPL